MSCVCGDSFFDDSELQSPSPKPVYWLGPEKIGPFTCPGIFIFIDYICLLCCSLTSVNAPFAWRAPSSRLPCPCQAGKSLVGPTVATTWVPPPSEPSGATPGDPGVAVDTGR